MPASPPDAPVRLPSTLPAPTSAPPAGLRARLRGGGAVLGTWLTLPVPAVGELMAAAGFDFVTVDLEHSALSIAEAAALIQAVSLGGAAPLVRLSGHDPVQIKRVMDAGAHGIIVPMVNRLAELEAVHAAMHYPPRGRRGVGLARAQGWGERFDAYRAWLEEDAVLIAQIEHEAALAELDAICAFPGLDGVLVGPYDLSASMGLAGQLDHPAVAAARARIRASADAHGVAAGIHVVEPDPVLLQTRRDEGFRLVAYSVDFRMLAVAARAGREAFGAP